MGTIWQARDLVTICTAKIAKSQIAGYWKLTEDRDFWAFLPICPARLKPQLLLLERR